MCGSDAQRCWRGAGPRPSGGVRAGGGNQVRCLTVGRGWAVWGCGQAGLTIRHVLTSIIRSIWSRALGLRIWAFSAAGCCLVRAECTLERGPGADELRPDLPACGSDGVGAGCCRSGCLLSVLVAGRECSGGCVPRLAGGGCELTCVRHATGLVGCWRAVTAAAERPRDRPGGAFSGAHRVVERGQRADELLQVLGRRRGPAAGRIWVPLRAESAGSGC